MSFIFDASDHARLATLFGNAWEGRTTGRYEPYAGYKPETREAPNGDTKACVCASGVGGDTGPSPSCSACRGTGRVPNVDAGKRYLHVSLKYNPPAWALAYLARAHFEACRVAEALGVPAEFYPRVADGTLRVLEYPSAGHDFSGPFNVTGTKCANCDALTTDPNPIRLGVCPALASGAGSAEHTDFDLFTILCWRSTPEDLEVSLRACDDWPDGPPSARDRARALSPGLHFGELGELVGLGPATPHRVPARPYAQRSIVYFAVPDHAARIPWRHDNGVPRTVGEWLKERIARSRVTGDYK